MAANRYFGRDDDDAPARNSERYDKNRTIFAAASFVLPLSSRNAPLMRALLLILCVVVGLLLAGFLYQQAWVEGALGPAAIIGVAVLTIALATLLGMYVLAGTRFRELVGNTLLVAASVLIAYLFVDVAAGVLLIRSLSPPLVRDQVLHHKMVPNTFSEFRQPDFAYVQRVNNLGLRGPDIAVAKPADTFRILMLGDSFTMGKGVEDDETFSALLGRSLNDATAACQGPRIEVVNAGVDSYAPILEYLQLKSGLLTLEPDLVVLNLDHSDLVQETVYRGQATFDSDGEPVAVPSTGQDSLYERFRSWTERRLFLTRLVLVYVNRAFDSREFTVRRVVNELDRENFAHTLEEDRDRSGQWRDIFDSLRRIKELTASADSGFLLTIYPWAHQVNDTDWVPGRYAYMQKGEKTTDVTVDTITALAATNGIELLNVYQSFKAYSGTEKLYFDYDPHWTTVGNEVMADALFSYFLAEYVPRWCTAR